MIRILIAIALLFVSSYLFSQPPNDNFSNATDITYLIDNCSSDAEFTTNGATADLNSGSCWNNSGPQLNVWFSFIAPSENISITVDRGGSKGSQQRSQIALWESDGTSEVSCSRYQFNGDDVTLDAVGTLVPGNTYYVSVDTYSSSFRGSFTLCLSETISYDYFEGAINVSGLINNCSENAIYSTIGGTADRNVGSCWNNSGPKFNRWFSFVATTTSISVTVDIGGDQGSQQRSQVSLWNSAGAEIACKAYTLNGEDVVVDALEILTIGETYFISVDSFSESFVGTFSLCLSDQVSYDYIEGAIDITSLIGRCSADQLYSTIGGTSDGLAGTCWNNSGPQFNRWFYFEANSTSMSVTVDIGDTKGNQQRSQVTIWESDGVTEVACSRYVLNADDVVVDAIDELVFGNTYYISVDTYNSNFDGTFTLCLDNGVSYDSKEGAYFISDINNWCSSDAAFTTLGASGDLNAGSCWGNANPIHNRWFAFEATGSSIQVMVDINDTKGTQRQTEVALWEFDGVTEVICKHYQLSNEDVLLEANQILTPGETYLISVDTELTSGAGTFSLCVDDEVSYDFLEQAIELSDLNNWCSADAEFTTLGATGDQAVGDCWNNSGPLFNRWFRFRSISEVVDIIVDIDGLKGTQRKTQLALWEADGITQVACDIYESDAEDVGISTSGLIVGNDYYISVDTYDASSVGTFTLCVSNIDQTFYSIENGLWTEPTNWSLDSHSGASSGVFFPQVGDVVNIEGNEITLNATSNIAELNLNVDVANTALNIDGIELNIQGKVNVKNSGSSFTGTLSILNGGSLDVLDDFTVEREGGSGQISILAFGNSSIEINKNLNISSTGGSTNTNQLVLSNTSSLEVTEKTILSTLSGAKTILIINDDAVFSALKDIEIQADNTNLVELELNDNATLNLGASIIRGTPLYGILDSNNSSTVSFSSSENLQVWSANVGESSDSFEYMNVEINNTRSTFPQVTLEGNVEVLGSLTLTDGIINTSSSALLTLPLGSTLIGGSEDSFVDGPLKIVGGASMEFPVGDDDIWAPLGLSSLTGADGSTSITIEYISDRYNDDDLAVPDPSGEQLQYVSILEYWDVDVQGSLTSADVTLHWKDASRSEIAAYWDLRVANYVESNTNWENLGVDSFDGNDPGSITVNSVTQFGAFTFGTTTRGNPLPVDLYYFEGKNRNGEVELKWATYTETNNEKFTIERSINGIDYMFVGNIVGNGTVNQLSEYSFKTADEENKRFYRLTQTDYDGTSKVLKVILIENSENKLDGPLVYPNPSNRGYFNVNLIEFGDNTSINIFDLTGKIVFSDYLLQEAGIYTITPQLVKGVYLLSISGSHKTHSEPLVIK